MRERVKLCDVADFGDPDVAAALADLYPEGEPPVQRKAWEYAMVALWLRDTGHLDAGHRLLGIGAGDERIVFWLADRADVVATDIYGAGDFADQEAPASMLTDPAAHAPFPYRQDGLQVRYMDARALDFPDASFDAAFSVSSFEHFGTPDEIARAAAELGRVHKPGGHTEIVTECWVRRHPLDALLWSVPGRKGVDVFTPGELDAQIVAPSGLELVGTLDRTVSAASWDNVARVRPGRPIETATGAFHPHILVRYRRSVFTSVFLALRKPGKKNGTRRW